MKNLFKTRNIKKCQQILYNKIHTLYSRVIFILYFMCTLILNLEYPILAFQCYRVYKLAIMRRNIVNKCFNCNLDLHINVLFREIRLLQVCSMLDWDIPYTV